MALLGWLLRFVLITILLNVVWRMLFDRRPVSTRSGAPRPAPGRPSPERAGGALVRDPHCGTFIVQSRAIRAGSGDHVQYFCSDTCRAAYQAAHAH